MNNEIKYILVAYLKGFAHATIIPVVLMLLVNHFFSGNFGGAVSLVYIMFAWFVYHKSNNKDLSKQAFNFTISAILTFVLIVALLVLMSTLDTL